eukprot:COSAG03_NODE_2363_length_2844_cov_265.595993_5_plen_192_part_00
MDSGEEATWKARHDELEEELQQASLVIVELEDELEKKNRLLADHEREITKMVQQLPPTPAALTRAQRDGDGSDDGFTAFAPGLPIGGLLTGDSDSRDEHHHLQQENERLRAEVRNLLLQGAALAESDAGSVSSDGSFGTAAVPTVGGGGAGARARACVCRPFSSPTHSSIQNRQVIVANRLHARSAGALHI